MRDAVVVGGGPVGLVAAILLKRKGFAVTLLEREDALGGLMRSLPLGGCRGISFAPALQIRTPP